MLVTELLYCLIHLLLNYRSKFLICLTCLSHKRHIARKSFSFSFFPSKYTYKIYHMKLNSFENNCSYSFMLFSRFLPFKTVEPISKSFVGILFNIHTYIKEMEVVERNVRSLFAALCFWL